MPTSRDRYGRLLAYVFPESDNLLANKEIIRQGYGHAYVKCPFDSARMEEFRAAEREARKERGAVETLAANHNLRGSRAVLPVELDPLIATADSQAYRAMAPNKHLARDFIRKQTEVKAEQPAAQPRSCPSSCRIQGRNSTSSRF